MEIDDAFTVRLDQLDKLVNRRSLQGIALLVVLILYLYALMVLAVTLEGPIVAVLVVVFITLALGSFGYSFHWGRNGRRFIYCVQMLAHLSPPHPIILSRFAIVERSPIYVVARWGMASLLFLRILESESSPSSKMQLPRFFLRTAYNYQIEGVDIARHEGLFSFPIGNEEYIEGEGILYALPLERKFFVPRKNPITTDLLETILRQITLDLAKKKVS